MSVTPGTRLGPYEILGPIGAGGMGEVYRARDARLGRDVAVKVLPDSVARDPRALARFESEAQAVAAFARHLDVPPDVPEDPFTGSATGGMAAYLWHYGLIDTPAFIAEQGHWLGRPGQAWVEVIGSPQDITAVKVGGQAVTVLRGELLLPDTR